MIGIYIILNFLHTGVYCTNKRSFNILLHDNLLWQLFSTPSHRTQRNNLTSIDRRCVSLRKSLVRLFRQTQLRNRRKMKTKCFIADSTLNSWAAIRRHRWKFEEAFLYKCLKISYFFIIDWGVWNKWLIQRFHVISFMFLFIHWTTPNLFPPVQ